MKRNRPSIGCFPYFQTIKPAFATGGSPVLNIKVLVRQLAVHDDLGAITELLHSAYARRAAAGLRYWATHQTIEDTSQRFSQGIGFVAEVEGRIVGTITVRPPQPNSEVPLYRTPKVWTLSQFGILPELQGRGIGRQLHDAAIAYAVRNGGEVAALDTAAPADDLIEKYRRWGYRIVGEYDWRPMTNYPSVLMSRQIGIEKD